MASAEAVTSGIAVYGGAAVTATIAGSAAPLLAGMGVVCLAAISGKRVLDIMLPTTDADRFSMSRESLQEIATKLRKLLDEAAASGKSVSSAQERITQLLRESFSLSKRDLDEINKSVARVETLGKRFLTYIAEDARVFEQRNFLGAKELRRLYEFDAAVIQPSQS